MIGFLLRIVIVVALVAGVGGYLVLKKGSVSLPTNASGLSELVSKLPIDQNVLSDIKNTDSKTVISFVSSALDSLVTHPGRNSGPVVLGVQVTNESISTIVDVLTNLPPEQVQQVKNALCAPVSN